MTALENVAERTKQHRINVIVGKIVKKLEPWRAEKAEIILGVREQIDLLMSVAPSFFARDKIQETRQGAREIAGTIATLLEQIKRASPELRARMRLDGLEAVNAPMTMAWFLERLEVIRAECIAAAEAQPSSDPLLEWCAKSAIALLQRFSARPPTRGRGRALPGSTEALYAIASLLFEAVTGEPNHKLKRACDTVLAAWRS
jgi:hypothetical protein